MTRELVAMKRADELQDEDASGGEWAGLAGSGAHPTSRRMMKLPSFATVSLLCMAHRFMVQQASQILGPDGDPYLERWWLEKDNSIGSVYLHRMIRSDRDAEFHDHPADNLSIVLDGEMIEHTPDGVQKWGPGSMVARKAADRHRIEVRAPLITMWIMGPKVRDWGFWSDTEQGSEFIPAQEFFRQKGYF